MTGGFAFFLFRRAVAAPLWRRLVLLLLAAGMAVSFALRPAYGNLPVNSSGEVTEISVKAAFLYRFIGYVEWPPSSFRTPDAPYTVAVIGADDVAEKLTLLVVGRTAGNRRIEVRRLGVNDALDQVHVLYVGEMPPAQKENILKRAQLHSVLSVTDFREDQPRHSIIQFKMLNERIRFDVSLDIAERSNLKISSRMLAVAHQVKRNGL